MNKIVALVVIFVSVQCTLSAQLNDYKYIVVPVKFKAFNNPNQFQTSTLIKHFMTQEGFNVIYDSASPIELLENRCLALYTDLMDESTMFRTKVTLTLRDCKGELIFKTIDGSTKEKDLNKAYKEAITGACVSFQGLVHDYQVSEPEPEKETITVSFKDDVKNIEDKNVQGKKTIKEVVPEVANEVATSTEITKYSKEKNTSKDLKDWLQAIPKENGFQLVDKNAEVKYFLEKTSIENVFLVNQDDINGVILKKDEKWYLEYSGKTGKVVKELEIRF